MREVAGVRIVYITCVRLNKHWFEVSACRVYLLFVLVLFWALFCNHHATLPTCLTCCTCLRKSECALELSKYSTSSKLYFNPFFIIFYHGGRKKIGEALMSISWNWMWRPHTVFFLAFLSGPFIKGPLVCLAATPCNRASATKNAGHSIKAKVLWTRATPCQRYISASTDVINGLTTVCNEARVCLPD